jgi:hypothetical protein
MVKRESKHTLPLDDPRWLPLVEGHRQVTVRTGNAILAATDLTIALDDKLVSSKRRHLSDLRHELVPDNYWGYFGPHEVSTDSEGRPFVRESLSERPISDWVFYVWQPDLDKLLGVGSRTEDGAALARNQRGKKPTKNWKVYVAAELLRAIAAGEGKPTAKKLAEFCQGKTGYLPDDSDVYKLVRNLLLLTNPQ